MSGAQDHTAILTKDTEAPWAELPELPAFDAQLRAKIEDIRLRDTAALTVDDAGWGVLGQILARHQRDLEEVAAIRAATEVLPAKTRRAVEKSVLRYLKKALVGLESLIKTQAIRDRIERVTGNGSVTDQLGEVIRVIEDAIREGNSSSAMFVDDEIGRLEGSLRVWWDRRSHAGSGGGRSPTKYAPEPAYNQFLRLCFSVLAEPPGSAYDALTHHRAKISHNEEVRKRLAEKLRRISGNREA